MIQLQRVAPDIWAEQGRNRVAAHVHVKIRKG